MAAAPYSPHSATCAHVTNWSGHKEELCNVYQWCIAGNKCIGAYVVRCGFMLQVSCFMAGDSWIFAVSLLLFHRLTGAESRFKGRIYTYLTEAKGRHCHSAVMLQNRCEMLSRTAWSQFSGDRTRMRRSPVLLGAGSCALTSGIENTTGVLPSVEQTLLFYMLFEAWYSKLLNILQWFVCDNKKLPISR